VNLDLKNNGVRFDRPPRFLWVTTSFFDLKHVNN